VNPLWSDIASGAHVNLSAAQLAAMDRYIDVLLDVNQKMNLTRITDRAAAEIQHVGDALTLLPHLPSDTKRLADIGSGGGVPGIPLAIARPDIQMTLVESTKKKSAFLRNVAETLELRNVNIIDTRAEELARTGDRESFDIVTARAVGALVWLAEWCLPLARKGGKVLAMKGARITEELEPAQKPIRLLGGGEPIVHPVTLPGVEHHVIVEIPKIGKTDKRYPRNPTATGGRPLAS
jgi:16S rRNA (guanine527-N7)-methyltransferase